MSVLLGERVLVLDGHSAAAMASVQRLGLLGVHVQVAATDPSALAFSSRFASKRHQQPPEPRRFASWLSEIHAQENPRLILATTERSLRMVRGHRLRLEAQLPVSASLEVALDKAATLAHANSLGIPTPSTRIVDESSSAPVVSDLPVVLKPGRSKILVNGRLVTPGAFVIRHPDTWRRVVNLLAPHSSLLEQAYISGRGVGVDLVYSEGRCVRTFAHRRLHEMPLTGGGSTYRESIVPSARTLEWSRALLDSLFWTGPAMVEWREEEDGRSVLMEVNPRLWGSLPLTIAAGVDVPGDLLRIKRGESLVAQRPYRVGLRMRNLPADVGWLKANLRAESADPMLLTEGRARSILGLGRVLTRRDRVDHLTWRDPRALTRLAQDVTSALRESGAVGSTPLDSLSAVIG